MSTPQAADKTVQPMTPDKIKTAQHLAGGWTFHITKGQQQKSLFAAGSRSQPDTRLIGAASPDINLIYMMVLFRIRGYRPSMRI